MKITCDVMMGPPLAERPPGPPPGPPPWWPLGSSWWWCGLAACTCDGSRHTEAPTPTPTGPSGPSGADGAISAMAGESSGKDAILEPRRAHL